MQPSSSLPDFASRGDHVKGALRAARAIGVPPTLDPAGARQGMAAVRKTGGEQGLAAALGG
jgi:hypothetical protein